MVVQNAGWAGQVAEFSCLGLHSHSIPQQLCYVGHVMKYLCGLDLQSRKQGDD